MGQGYKGWAGGDKVDWDGVDSGSPTPLDRGIYNCVVLAATPGETKDGKPSLTIELEIESKYGSEDQVPKRKLYDTFTMVKDGLFKTKQFCEATDMDPPETTTYGDVSDFAEEMIGEEVYVLVGIRTFEGKPRNRVEFYVHDDDVKDVLEKEANAGDGRGRPRSGGRERTRAADRGRSSSKDADEPRESRRARSEDEPREGRREGRRARRGEEDDAPAREERRSRRDAAPTNGASTRSASDDKEDTSGTEDVDDDGGGEQEPRRARRRRRGRAAAEQE